MSISLFDEASFVLNKNNLGLFRLNFLLLKFKITYKVLHFLSQQDRLLQLLYKYLLKCFQESEYVEV